MGVIRRAVKSRPNLRVGFCGPSKSMKTGTMLSVATGKNPWTGEEGPPLVDGPIGLIDAEANGVNEEGVLQGTSELYADLFEFDVIVLKKTHAEFYTKAIQEFAVLGYKLIIIDGISPEWASIPDGVLSTVERLADNKHNGNKFKAWADVNIFHDRFIKGDSGANVATCQTKGAAKFGIKNYPGHVFVSCQAKTKHQMITKEDSTGAKQTVVKKMGVGPIQRQEIDYEFDTWLDLDRGEINVHGTSRIHTLEGKSFKNAGPDLTAHFLKWLAPAEGSTE